MDEKLIKRASLFSVMAAVFLILIKSWTWWITDSMTLFASLLDSSIDLISSLINFVLVRYALRPADKEHPFGHGKAEYLSSLAQSGFIIGSSLFLMLSSFKLLIHPILSTLPIMGIIMSFVPIFVTAMLISYQRYVIKKTNNQAIRADMLHYFSDLLVNISVIISMFLSLCGFIYSDALFAIGIGIYIFIGAIKISKESIQNLLDKSLSEEDISKITEIALKQPLVRGIHDLKTRRSGNMSFIQLHIELPDNLPLVEAHDIAEKIEYDIRSSFKNAEVIVHQDPFSVVNMLK